MCSQTLLERCQTHSRWHVIAKLRPKTITIAAYSLVQPSVRSTPGLQPTKDTSRVSTQVKFSTVSASMKVMPITYPRRSRVTPVSKPSL